MHNRATFERVGEEVEEEHERARDVLVTAPKSWHIILTIGRWMPVVLADALRLVLPRHTSLGVCGRERRPRALFLTLSLTFFVRRRGGRRRLGRLGRHEIKCRMSILTLLEGQTVLDEVLEVVCAERARARPPS